MASAAASRSSKPPAARPCISLKCCRWRFAKGRRLRLMPPKPRSATRESRKPRRCRGRWRAPRWLSPQVHGSGAARGVDMRPAMPNGTIDRIQVSAYKIPTDAPEADGTYEWSETTLVVVEAGGCGQTGFGYTYADSAAGALIAGT